MPGNIKDIKIFNYIYYVFLAFLFFSGVSISISQGLLLLASILFAFGLFKYRHNIKFKKTGLERYILAFIAVSFVLAFLSPSIIKNLDYIRDFWLISAFILAYSLHDTKEDIKKTFYLMILIVFLQSVIALAQIGFKISFIQGQNNIGIFRYNTPDEYTKIRGGLLGMHLVFSFYLMSLAVPLVYVSAMIKGGFRNITKLFIIIPAILSVIVLLITKTNSILAALPFSVIPLFFIKKKSLAVILAIAATTIIMSIGIFSIIGPKIDVKKMAITHKAGDRGVIAAKYRLFLEQIQKKFVDNVLNSDHVKPRISIWKTAFHVWLKHPVIGSGGGNYLDEFKKVLKEHPGYDTGMITHAHNDYLNQLARKGIIGFAAFIYMLYGIFRYMAVNLKYVKDKLLRRMYLGLFGAYCVFLTASLFQCFYTDDENLVMLWFTIGLLAAIVKIEKGGDIMQIPFHKPYITDPEIKSMTESSLGGWLTMGKKTQVFEDEFKGYLGAKEAVAVNSCTAALHLALKCAGIKEDDEVIVPTITHASTAEAVGYLNAKPVFVDVERETHLIDASKIEEKITERTKAIIPVHYAGQPADMNEIVSIANKHDLFIIEDAAHAFPSKYNSNFIGTIGDATCFSFYATKTITTGEGGMITTGNSKWAKRMRTLRLHGVTRDAWKRENEGNFWEYDVVEPGFKYNTTDINSAMGIEQLKKADDMQRMRVRIAQRYNGAFGNNKALILYTIKSDRETSWYLYPLKLNLESLSIDRNRFVNEMKSRGISASVHFIPLYRFTYYKKLGYSAKDYPESEWVFERTFSLPIFPGMTDKEIDYVIENVLDIVEKNKR